MTIYKGEKSGKIYTTSDGTKYSWSLSKKQIEFNSETSDGSNFKGYFRFIWTGDYEVRKKILKDYIWYRAFDWILVEYLVRLFRKDYSSIGFSDSTIISCETG